MIKSKKFTLLVMAAALGFSFNVANTNLACANPTTSINIYNGTPSVNVAPVQQVAKSGVINWQNNNGADIEAKGVGLPPAGAYAAQARAMALRAAKIDAARNLLETIQGMQIDSETQMMNLVITSDIVNTKVSGLIQGAKVVSENFYPDGSCEVTLAVPMYGATNSIAAAVVPQIAPATPVPFEDVKNTTLPAAEIQAVQGANYTGVVIDASGLGLDCTFAPAVYDTNDRIVYGIRSLDHQRAILDGMVEYSTNVANTSSGTRAGNNPLVIRAVDVRGGSNSVNPVNAVISVEDADRILLANSKSGMLNRCAVVFVK